MIQLEEAGKVPNVMSPLGDTVTLTERVESLALRYRDAKPFPYLTIDNMFSSALLDQLIAEIPPMTDAHWVHHDHEHEEKYGQRSALDIDRRNIENHVRGQRPDQPGAAHKRRSI